MYLLLKITPYRLLKGVSSHLKNKKRLLVLSNIQGKEEPKISCLEFGEMNILKRNINLLGDSKFKILCRS